MVKDNIHILVTDDERAIRNTLREILEYEGYQVLEAVNGEEAIQVAVSSPVDLVLLDIKMQGLDGIETLTALRDKGLTMPVIMLSGHGTIEIAVEATHKGAFDFLEKPPDLNRLLLSIRNALSNRKLQKEVQLIKKRLPALQPIIGNSEPMRSIRTLIDRVAPSSSRVLITGENGTGKELVARWIHEKSPRSPHSFVAVNCAAIPEELIESELFGHIKGAFTGAVREREGKFLSADGGTLFLDEIGDLSQEAQAKVLRALQEQEIAPVGSERTKKVDVRVVAATNKDLEQAISEGTFREDLYHRIKVIPIRVPPLRERRDDIPALATAILRDLQNKEVIFESVSIADSGLQALRQRNWPGNVRELQNAMERLALLAPEGHIDQRTVEEVLDPDRTSTIKSLQIPKENLSFHEFRDRAEADYLKNMLDKCDWNVAATAEEAGIQRSHLYTKMKKYNIER